MIGTSKSAQEAANAIKNGEMSAKAYTTQVQESAVATKGLGTSSKIAAVGVKALNIAMNAGIMLAVSWAISAVVKGIDNLVHANERAIESAQELSAKYEETSKSISSNIETVQGLKSEFETLSKGVSDNGENVALSADEYKRYQEIVKQITDISPTLIDGYTDERDVIAKKNGLIEESIKLLKEQQRLELLKQTTPENNKIAAEGAIAAHDSAEKSLMSSRASVIDELVNSIISNNSIDKDGIQDLADNVYDEFVKAFNLNDSKVDKTLSTSSWLSQLLNNEENINTVMSQLQDNFQIVNKFADNASLTNIANAMTLYGDATKQADTASQGFASQLSIIAQGVPNYDKLSDEAKALVDAFTKTSQFKIGDGVDWTTMVQDWGTKVQTFVNDLQEMPKEVSGAFEQLSTLASDEEIIDTDEWKSQVNKAVQKISEYTGLDENTIKLHFGLDTNGIQDVYKDQSKIEASMGALSSSFDELQQNLDKVSNAAQDYKTISAVVNKEMYLTDEQVGNLVKAYPDLQKQLSLTKQGWSLESGAIDVVQNSLFDLQGSYAGTQAAMNDAVANGVGLRLKNLGIEITGIQSIINAYNALNQSKQNAYDWNMQQIKKGGLELDPWEASVDSYIGSVDAKGNAVQFYEDSAIHIDKSTEAQMEALVDAKAALTQAKSQLSSLSGQVGKNVKDSSGSGSSSSAKDTTDTWKEAFQKYYAEIQYLRETDQISDEEYYNRLLALNNKYFKGKSKYLSEFRQYDEELYNLEKSISADRITDLQHEIEMLGHKSDAESQQITLYKDVQDELHKQAESARARGIDENDEYLQSLSDQWWAANDKISSINQSLYDNAISDYQDYIEEKERYGWGSEKESDVIKKEIALTEKYYKQGLISFEYYSEKIKSLNDELYDTLKSQTQSYYEGVRDYAVSQIDEEIQALQDELDADNEYYENKIQNLQDQQDETSKVREEEEKLLAIEKARIALAKAESSKTVQTYVNGVGFTWMADETAVTEAQDSLNDALKEYNQYKEDLAIDNLIEDLEDAKEANEESINEQIDNLEDLKDAWSDSLDISDDVEKYQEYLEEILGDENSSYSERLAAVKQFVSDYNEEMNKLQTKSSSSSSGSSSGSTTKSSVITGATAGAAVGGVTGSIIGTTIGSVVSTISKAITGKYASGTTSATGGLSLVGEEGAEFRVLNKGDGIIPADFTQNLMSWGNFTPSSFAESLKSMFSTPSLSLVQAAPVSNSVSFGGDIVVEYSGNDAEGFAKALKSKLPNAVLQQLYKR